MTRQLIIAAALCITAPCSLAFAEPAADADAFLTGTCASASSVERCKASELRFRESYAGAFGGSIDAQRYLIHCFVDGCDEAVEQNQLLMCAWSQVLLATGHVEIKRGDMEVHDLACGTLDQRTRDIANRQADRIFEGTPAGESGIIPYSLQSTD